jgi:hypothetical protein
VVSADGSESVENLRLLILLLDGGVLDLVNLADEGESVAGDLGGGSSGFELLGGGVVDKTLLRLVLASGEDDKLALVGVNPGDVQLELLLTGGGSSVINGDSNGSGESGGETGSLEFNESETSAVANLTGILTGGLGDDRTETLGGSGEDASSFSNSILVSLDLLSRLVEMSLGSHRPVLAEMDVDDNVVMLDHC